MESPAAWKAELDAIVGARHGGAAEAVLGRLRSLETRHPNVPEILQPIAWTLEMLGRQEEAVPIYEQAIALGLSPTEHAACLTGLGSCLCRLEDFEKAESLLRSARLQFPEHREFDALLAICLHSLEKHAESLRLLIDILVETSEDTGVRAYQRTLRSLLPR